MSGTTPPPSIPSIAEGVVSFPAQPTVVYRYKVTNYGKELQIWLENRKCKDQWQTKRLQMPEFASDGNVIPNAKFEDYVECFENCLATSMSDSSADSTRHLLVIDAETMNLELSLKIKVFASVWAPTYTFQLKKVPLEPLDVLAAKVRDQEECISVLQRDLSRVLDMVRLVCVYAELRTQASASQNLHFVPRHGNAKGFISFENDGSMKFDCTGSFQIAGSITCSACVNAGFDVMVNDKTVKGVATSFYNGYNNQGSWTGDLPLFCVVNVKAGDTVRVLWKGPGAATTGSIAIMQLTTTVT